MSNGIELEVEVGGDWSAEDDECILSLRCYLLKWHFTPCDALHCDLGFRSIARDWKYFKQLLFCV